MAALTRSEVEPVTRLGILGGTFDPVHNAHLVAAGEASYQLGLDKVLLVPAGVPPHKPGRPITAVSHRLRMLELAIAGQPNYEISDVDLNCGGPCYTVKTLERLRVEWGPGPTFYFLVGADSLADLGNWYRPHLLLELCELAVVGRPGIDIDLTQLETQLPGLSSHLHWVRMPLLEISSSDLRARVREGRPISYLVPGAVEAYIVDQRLYAAYGGL